jgi:hypothetical protein
LPSAVVAMPPAGAAGVVVVVSAGAEGAAGVAGAGCAVWAKAGASVVDAMRTAAAAIVLRVFFIVFLPFPSNSS